MQPSVRASRSIARQLILATLVASAFLLLPSAALAQSNPLYWNTASGTGVFWDTASNWWTTPTGTASSSAPDITYDAVFNGTGVNGATTVQLEAAQAAMGLYFSNTGTTAINSTTNSALSIGSDGITINPGAGAVTLGDATNTMPLDLVGSQTWTNNSSSALTVRNAVSLDSSINSPATLTLAGTSTTNNAISGALTDGPNASLGLSATGGVWLLSGTNNYSGPTNITAGVLDITSAARFHRTPP